MSGLTQLVRRLEVENVAIKAERDEAVREVARLKKLLAGKGNP
jgi:hypothetical protein